MKIFFRVVGLLLVVGLLAAGGFMSYKAGVTQGISQAPAVATAIAKAAENGQPVPPMYGPYGYAYPYGFGHPHFFNPFSAICLSLVFLFVFFGVLKMVFFRTMRHTWSHHGPWRKDWEGKVPPFFAEWHKRAHGDETSEDGESEK